MGSGCSWLFDEAKGLAVKTTLRQKLALMDVFQHWHAVIRKEEAGVDLEGRLIYS